MEKGLIFAFFALLWAGLVVWFYRRRIWLFYYCIAAVGLALLLIFAGTNFLPLERWLEYSTAWGAHFLCQALGIPTSVFEAAPGNILVWVVVQNPGWTVVRVDLECSGLLELAVFTGILLFYPAWTAFRRLYLVALGWLVTFLANIGRVLSIILIWHSWGKRSIFIAHTVVGRLIFFVLVMLIYWLFLTRPTLRWIEERLNRRRFA